MTTWKMLGVLVRVVLGVWGIVWGLMRVDDPRGAYILVISGLLLSKCNDWRLGSSWPETEWAAMNFHSHNQGHRIFD